MALLLQVYNGCVFSKRLHECCKCKFRSLAARTIHCHASAVWPYFEVDNFWSPCLNVNLPHWIWSSDIKNYSFRECAVGILSRFCLADAYFGCWRLIDCYVTYMTNGDVAAGINSRAVLRWLRWWRRGLRGHGRPGNLRSGDIDVPKYTGSDNCDTNQNYDQRASLDLHRSHVLKPESATIGKRCEANSNYGTTPDRMHFRHPFLSYEAQKSNA